MKHRPSVRALGILGSVLAILASTFGRASAQVQVALGLSFADTRTNALGLGTTVTWQPVTWFALRGFLDAESAIPDFKEGLGYREPEREYIVDEQDVAQNPKGDELWHGKGWDLHAASYATLEVWKIGAGPGLAWNGHDGSVSSGLAFVVVGDLSRRSQLDVEFLRGGSWRLRVAIGFWSFP